MTHSLLWWIKRYNSWNFFGGLTVLASQVVFISWVFPRVVSECVLVVMPRKSDGNVMPSSRATDANSVSPFATTSPDPLSAKLTLPKSNTAARTLTTSMNGMPRRPLRTENMPYYNITTNTVNKVWLLLTTLYTHIHVVTSSGHIPRHDFHDWNLIASSASSCLVSPCIRYWRLVGEYPSKFNFTERLEIKGQFSIIL